MEKIDALYCRVSTKMQVKDGDSIENQKKWLIEYAHHKNLEYKVYSDEGYSAKDQSRPALQRLFNDIKENKIRSVVVAKLDRMVRSIKDLWDILTFFEEYKIIFRSLSDSFDTATANGRLTLNVLGSVAQWEREIISERVGENMRQRAKDGKWNGGPIPFGYQKKDKTIVINEKEAQILRTIYAKYLETESIRAVTHWLNTNHYKTKHGMSWATSTISRLLTNPTYVGKTWYNKRISSKTTHKIKRRSKEEWIIANGLHEPIISEKVFNKIQEILKSQAKTPIRKGSEYLLSGLVRCGKCNASMSGYSQRIFRQKQWKTYSYYKCHNHTSKGSSICEGNSINKAILETLVIDKILSLADSKEFKIDAKKALDEFNKAIRVNRTPLEKEKISLNKENEHIDLKKKTLLERLEDRTIDKIAYMTRVAELDSQHENNTNRVFKIENQLSEMGADTINFEAVSNIINDFRLNWSHLDHLGKRNILLALVSKIIVDGKKVKIDLYFLSDLMSNTCSCTNRDALRKLHYIRVCEADLK
jgi:site-specific DNA recombinase